MAETRQQSGIIFAVLVLAFALVAGAYILKPMPSSVVVNSGDSQLQAKTLDASGMYTISTDPDKLELTLGVETTALTAVESKQVTADKMAAIIAAVLPKDFALSTSRGNKAQENLQGRALS